MLKILMEEFWNEETEKVMNEARRLSEDRSVVGVLGDRVFTYLVAKGQTVEEAVKGCQDHMAEARSSMPDFTYQHRFRLHPLSFLCNPLRFRN